MGKKTAIPISIKQNRCKDPEDKADLLQGALSEAIREN